MRPRFPSWIRSSRSSCVVAILFRDRYHQPQVGQHEGMAGRLVLAAQAANIDQPPRQRSGPSPAEPDQAAQLPAGLAPPRRVGGRGIEDLELHHGIGHPHGDARQAGHGLLQQNALELELLNVTRGRTAAAQERLPGILPPFGRLLPIAGDPQIPAVLAQRPSQHFHARMRGDRRPPAVRPRRSLGRRRRDRSAACVRRPCGPRPTRRGASSRWPGGG